MMQIEQLQLNKGFFVFSKALNCTLLQWQLPEILIDFLLVMHISLFSGSLV